MNARQARTPPAPPHAALRATCGGPVAARTWQASATLAARPAPTEPRPGINPTAGVDPGPAPRSGGLIAPPARRRCGDGATGNALGGSAPPRAPPCRPPSRPHMRVNPPRVPRGPCRAAGVDPHAGHALRGRRACPSPGASGLPGGPQCGAGRRVDHRPPVPMLVQILASVPWPPVPGGAGTDPAMFRAKHSRHSEGKGGARSRRDRSEPRPQVVGYRQ